MPHYLLFLNHISQEEGRSRSRLMLFCFFFLVVTMIMTSQCNGTPHEQSTFACANLTRITEIGHPIVIVLNETSHAHNALSLRDCVFEDEVYIMLNMSSPPALSSSSPQDEELQEEEEDEGVNNNSRRRKILFDGVAFKAGLFINTTNNTGTDVHNGAATPSVVHSNSTTTPVVVNIVLDRVEATSVVSISSLSLTGVNSSIIIRNSENIHTLQVEDVSVQHKASITLTNMTVHSFVATGGNLEDGALEISNSIFNTLTIGESIHNKSSHVHVTNVTTSSGAIKNVGMKDDTSIIFENFTVTTLGWRLTNVNAQSPQTAVAFRNSKLISTSTAAFIHSSLFIYICVFENGAQVQLENTEVVSKRNAIQLYASGNTTRGKYRLDHFNRMFITGAVLNLTNATVFSTTAGYSSFSPYVETYVTGNHQRRHSRFAQGAKLVATNCRFLSRVDISVEEGATIELDATSYEGIDLTVYGDGSNVVPMPHTMSVKSVILHNARMSLPELLHPASSQPDAAGDPQLINSWNIVVEKSLSVSGLAVANSQSVYIRPHAAVPPRSVTIIMSDSSFHNGSSLIVEDATFNIFSMNGVLEDKSQIEMRNSTFRTLTLGSSLELYTDSTIRLQDVTVNVATLSGVSLREKSSVVLDNFTVIVYGLKLRNVVAEMSAVVAIRNSRLDSISTKALIDPALLLFACIFESGAQLQLENTEVVSKRTGIQLYANGNATSVRFRTDHFNRMFTKGAILNLTNATVYSTTKGYHAFSPFAETYVTGNHQVRHSRFAEGARFIATNTRFYSPLTVSIVAGATVEFDSDTYQTALDLTITGDGSNVVPLPATLVVVSLRLFMANASFPTLLAHGSSAEYVVTIGVKHDLILGGFSLGGGKQFNVYSLEGAKSNVLSLTYVDVAANSAIVVADSFFNRVTVSGSVQQSSVVSIRNVTARDFVMLSPLTLLESSALIVNESSIARLSFNPNFHNDGTSANCSITVVDSIVSNSMLVWNAEVPTDVTLSIVSSTILGVASPALMVRNVFFIGGTLCITQSKVLGRGGGAIKLGTTLNYYWVAKNVYYARNMIATNNSRILISESYVGSQPGFSGYSIVNGYLSHKTHVSSYIGTASADVPPASFILHNSTLKDGPMNLLFRGNGTKVIVDSLTLSRSRIGFNALGDDRYDKDDAGKIDAVGYYFPSSFSCEELTLIGGTIHWGAAAEVEFFTNSSVPPTVDQMNATNQHVQISVSRSISLVQPLGFELVNGEHLVVRVAEPNKTEAPKAPYLSIFLQPRQVSNGSSILITSSSIANDADDGAASIAEAMSFTMKEVQFSGNSTMSFKNVVFRSNIALSSCKFTEQSMLVLDDSQIRALVLLFVTFSDRSWMLLDRIGVTTSGVKLTSCKFKDASELHILRSEINTTSAASSNLHPLWFQLTNFETNDTILNIESTRITAQYRKSTISIAFVTNAVTIVSASIFIHNVSCLIDPDTPVFGTRYAIASSTQDHTGPISPRVVAISGPASHPSSFDGSPIAMKVAGTMKMVVGSGVDGIESIRLHGVVAAFATQNVTLGCAAGSNRSLCDSAKLFGAVRLASENEATETLREAQVKRLTSQSTVRWEISVRYERILSYLEPMAAASGAANTRRFDAVVDLIGRPCAAMVLHSGLSSIVHFSAPTATPTVFPKTLSTATATLASAPSATVITDSSDDQSTVDPTSSDVEVGTLAPPTTSSILPPPPLSTSATDLSTVDVPTSAAKSTNPVSPPPSTQVPLANDNSTQPTPAPTENTTDVPAPNVETMIDKLTKAEEVAIETTVTTTTVFGAVGSVAGGSAAADMQSVLVLGFTTCASDSMRAVSQASKSSLFPLGDTLGTFESARLLGNWVMVGAFAGCHTLVALVFYRKKKASGMSFAAALSKARYPSFSLVIFSLLHQGLVLESCTILLKKNDGKALKDPVSIIVATLTLAVCLTQSVWCVLWCRENFATFRFFRYDHSARHKLLGWCIFATGQWDYQNTKLTMFRSVCGLLNGTRWWMFSSSLQMRSLLIAAVAANEHMPCEVQAVLLCVIFWVHAGLLAVLRPLRLRAVNVFSVMIGVLSGVISLSLLSETMAEMGSSMLWLASVLSVVAAVAQISAILAEKVWKKRNSYVFMEGEDPSEHRKNDATAADDGSQSDSSDTSSSSDDDDGADDVEMRALMVPLVKNGDQTDADSSDGERNPLPPKSPSSGADELLSTPRFSGSNVDLESNLSFRRANMSFRSVGGGV